MNTSLPNQEARAIDHLEHQILALEKEWLNYEDVLFVDWNIKFAGLTPDEIREKVLSPGREIEAEKKEFFHLWHRTIRTFRDTAIMFRKGQKKRAITKFMDELDILETEVMELEGLEKKTLAFLSDHKHIFEESFDTVYGEGYFQREIYENYEMRFKILGILQQEYELIRTTIRNLFKDSIN